MNRFSLFLIVVAFLAPLGLHPQDHHSIDSLESLLPSTNNPEDKEELLIHLFDYYRQTDLEKAFAVASKLEALAMENQQPALLFDSRKMKSRLHADQGEYEKALHYDLLSKEAAEKAQDTLKLAIAFNNIGDDHRAMGNYSQAHMHFLRSLQISEQKGYNTIMAVSKYNVGVIYKIQGKLENAMRYLEESKAISEEINDEIGIAYYYHSLGTVFNKKGQYDKGLSFLYKSLEVGEKIGVTELVPETTIEIANTYEKKNDLKKALKYYFQALEKCKGTMNKTRLAENYLGLGNLQIKVGMYTNAEANLKKSFVLAKDVKARSLEADVYKARSQLYERKKDYEKAFEFFKKYITLKESIFNIEVNKQITSYQEMYESEKKDQEIANLSQDNALQDIQIEKKNAQNMLLFLTLGFVLILSIILLINILNKRKANKVLLEQKAEIERQSKQLAELNHVKGKFFAIVSHDLRAPFHSLSGVLELISSGVVSDEEIGMLSKELKLKFDKTKHLLDNLLEWGRIQMKEVTYEPVDIDISDVVEDVLSIVKSAYDKDVKLHNNIGKGHHAFADINMFQLVLRNLVTNAIKFTEDGGQVSVTSKIEGETVHITVEDTGIGINKENQYKLFHNDDTYTTLGTDKEIGTGLGLSLCKEFVEKNGGQIWVESEKGVGSRFKFTIKKSN